MCNLNEASVAQWDLRWTGGPRNKVCLFQEFFGPGLCRGNGNGVLY